MVEAGQTDVALNVATVNSKQNQVLFIFIRLQESLFTHRVEIKQLPDAQPLIRRDVESRDESIAVVSFPKIKSIGLTPFLPPERD